VLIVWRKNEYIEKNTQAAAWGAKLREKKKGEEAGGGAEIARRS
jgi:hypothetical protein